MKKRMLAIFIGVVIFLSSCGQPGVASPPPDVMTAAALTVQAALGTQPIASPTSPIAKTNTSVPLASQTPASSTPPVLSVGEATDCRTGPSPEYELVTQLQPGQEIQITGFYPPNYWVVNSQEGTCWIEVNFATPSGSYQTVPTVTAPPKPIGEAPKAPSFPQNGWSYFCSGNNQIDVTFNWNDNADNETGYRIVRNDKVVAELPANSRTFTESTTLEPDQSLTYRIEAYNLTGSASTSTVTIKC